MATPEPEIISVEVGGSDVRLRWNPGRPESPWELSSQPDWDRVEGIRLVSAAFDDGAALGVVTVRPRDAHGHGDDVVAARLRDADGIHTASTEALISVEYDPARLPRRLGIELWPESDSPPFRIAADREANEGHPGAGGRAAVPMTFRLDGVEGRGLYETLRRG